MANTKEQIVKTKDYIAAELLGLGSLAAQLGPFASMTTRSEYDCYVPLRWRHLRQDPNTFKHWKTFDPDELLPTVPKSVRPKTFSYAVTLTAWRVLVDGYRIEYAGEHAVAYRLGSHAVMLGTHEDGRFFKVHPGKPNNYIVGMRLGAGLLEAHMGIYSEEGGFKPLTNMGTSTPEPVLNLEHNKQYPVV